MSLNNLRTDVHNRLCNLRAILRVIESIDFEYLYNEADANDKSEVLTILNLGNRKQLQTWMIKNRGPDYGSMSSKQLKEICRRYRVPNYGCLNKAQMLSELENASRRISEVPEKEAGQDQATIIGSQC